MSRKLKIVADAHIWGVESAFSELGGLDGELTIVEHQQMSRQLLLDTDILLTRSSTKVNADLLEGTAVKFAATATIGDDHYDKAWLDQHGIVYANAAGSSTGSVIEYMITSLLLLHTEQTINIPETTIGIIGVGRIGSRLATVCEAMGMKVLLNDPPRERSENSDQFCSLDNLLEQADIISLHTPMIREGESATHHMIGEDQLRRFQGFGLFNAARGGCVDNRALLAWLDRDNRHFAVLDCWEFEPEPMRALMVHPGMSIATPHIAGHSLDGKAANTLYIYRALTTFLNVEPIWNPEHHLPDSPATLQIESAGSVWQTLFQAAHSLYPLLDDHESMQSWAELTESELPNAFKCYRRHYPTRRAWACCPIRFDRHDEQLLQLAHAFGMKIV